MKKVLVSIFTFCFVFNGSSVADEKKFSNKSDHIAEDFAALEESVRKNSGDIENLKKEFADLMEQLGDILKDSEDFGDVLFNRERYEEASRMFLKKYKKNSEGERTPEKDAKAAEALYKLAQCFEYMLQDKKAKITYEKLLADYPASAVADDAKRRLESVIEHQKRKEAEEKAREEAKKAEQVKKSKELQQAREAKKALERKPQPTSRAQLDKELSRLEDKYSQTKMNH